MRYAYKSRKCDVITRGRDGESVFEMLDRLPKELERFQPSHVVILGGTNDLGDDPTGDSIFGALAKIHTLCHASSALTVACSIPEMLIERVMPNITAKRTSVNESLRKFAAETASCIGLADICAAIPNVSLDDKERERLWDDSLHFSPAGYDMVGETVFGVLRGKL